MSVCLPAPCTFCFYAVGRGAVCADKAALHDTDTDMWARILARMSVSWNAACSAVIRAFWRATIVVTLSISANMK